MGSATAKFDLWVKDNWGCVNKMKHPRAQENNLMFIKCSGEEHHSTHGFNVKEQPNLPWKSFDKGARIIHLESGQVGRMVCGFDPMLETLVIIEFPKARYVISQSCIDQLTPTMVRVN